MVDEFLAMVYFVMATMIIMAFYGFLGQILLPAGFRTEEKRDVAFLIAPLVGCGVWIAVSVALGFLFPYNRALVMILHLLALVCLIIFRHRLFLPKLRSIYVISVLLILWAGLTGYIVAPHDWHGGIYFCLSVYDHTKSAIIDGIANYGLPPVNPYLADNGKPVAMLYYFGWHAWSTQLVFLTGMNGYLAEVIMLGFTCGVIMSGLCGVFLDIDRRIRTIVFTLLLSLIGGEIYLIFEFCFPYTFTDYLIPSYVIGYWCVVDNFIWSPQHLIAGAMVLAVIYFCLKILEISNKTEKIVLASFVGAMTATAFLTSVYAGIFALIIVALIVVCMCVFDPNFRSDLFQNIWFLLLAVAVFLLLSSSYINYLFSFNIPDSPLRVGMASGYKSTTKLWMFAWQWLDFYIVQLSSRIGTVYVLGVIAIFIPGVLPNDRMSKICKWLTVISFLIISVVHSNYYSNDFGWRLICAPQFFLAFTSALLVVRIYDWTKNGKSVFHRSVGYAFFIILFALQIVTMALGVESQGVRSVSQKEHVQFAKSVAGWEQVKKLTSEQDLVMSNPVGFPQMSRLQSTKYSTNIFLELFSQRCSPIADVVFAQTYSTFYDKKKLHQRFEFAVDFFSGGPDEEEVNFLCNRLHVKAILVTPLDGLWNEPGELESHYEKKVETPDYKIYLKREAKSK